MCDFSKDEGKSDFCDMSNFYMTGWKLTPYPFVDVEVEPPINYDEYMYGSFLEESFMSYDYIWRELAKR